MHADPVLYDSVATLMKPGNGFSQRPDAVTPQLKQRSALTLKSSMGAASPSSTVPAPGGGPAPLDFCYNNEKFVEFQDALFRALAGPRNWSMLAFEASGAWWASSFLLPSITTGEFHSFKMAAAFFLSQQVSDIIYTLVVPCRSRSVEPEDIPLFYSQSADYLTYDAAASLFAAFALVPLDPLQAIGNDLGLSFHTRVVLTFLLCQWGSAVAYSYYRRYMKSKFLPIGKVCTSAICPP